MISFTNIIWLQAAPTAFVTITWRFYLVFIIPGTIGGIIIWLWFPDTNGLPLEEIAAIFGDADEVAVYQREIDVQGGEIVDRHGEKDKGDMQHIEDMGARNSEKRV